MVFCSFAVGDVGHNADQAVSFTSERRQAILEKGGSGDWVLSSKNAGRRQYLVCCRREHWENRAEGIAQKAAFLIGRIASLKKVDASENERGQPALRDGVSGKSSSTPVVHDFGNSCRENALLRLKG